MSDEGSDNVLAEAQTQQWGYIRCYRAVVRDCGVSAAYLYGILEDYAQLGARQHRPLMPSHDHLATLMGVHRNTINGLLQKLRDTDWVEWEGGAGTPHRYTLPARQLHKKSASIKEGPAQEPGNSCTETGQPVAQNPGINKTELSKTKEQDTPLTPLKGESARKTQLPKDWKPSAEERDYAEERGLDPDEEAQEFYGHFRGKGLYHLDWHLTWQRWCREGQKRRGGRNGHRPQEPIPEPPPQLTDDQRAALEARRQQDAEQRQRDRDARLAAAQAWLDDEAARTGMSRQHVERGADLSQGWEYEVAAGLPRAWRHEWDPYLEAAKAAAATS